MNPFHLLIHNWMIKRACEFKAFYGLLLILFAIVKTKNKQE